MTAVDAASDGAPDDGKGGAPDGGSAARHPPRAVRGLARLGLVARAGFYLLLAGLAINLLVGVSPGQGKGQALGQRAGRDGGQVGEGQGAGQANANGALTQVARAPVGFVTACGRGTRFRRLRGRPGRRSGRGPPVRPAAPGQHGGTGPGLPRRWAARPRRTCWEPRYGVGAAAAVDGGESHRPPVRTRPAGRRRPGGARDVRVAGRGSRPRPLRRQPEGRRDGRADRAAHHW